MKTLCVSLETAKALKAAGWTKPLAIGRKTLFGKICGVMNTQGERYYFILKNGVVSMMPSDVVEAR